MRRRMLARLLPIVLLLATAGCEPYSERSPSALTGGPADAWRGTYVGDALFTCPSYGIQDREVRVTVACNPGNGEVNIELFVTPRQAAYSPVFRRTGPVADENNIYWAIEDEVFLYQANLGRSRDRLGGTLQIRDLNGDLVWLVDSIEASRD